MYNCSEKWKDIIGYEGLYRVSDKGRIRRIGPNSGATVNMLLKHAIDNKGYPRVMLYKNRHRKNALIHRLILEAFVGLCPPKMESCHNDGNPMNTQLTNLRWDTHRSNLADKKMHDTQPDQSGSKNNNAVLTEKNVRCIKQMLASDLYLQKTIAKKFGVAKTTISDISTGKKWRHINV